MEDLTATAELRDASHLSSTTRLHVSGIWIGMAAVVSLGYVLAGCQARDLEAAGSPALTLCQLGHAMEIYDGRRISVRAGIWPVEGSNFALESPECPHVFIVARANPPERLDLSLCDREDVVRRYGCPAAGIEATFTGRFRGRAGFPGLLTVETVSDIDARAAEGARE